MTDKTAERLELRLDRLTDHFARNRELPAPGGAFEDADGEDLDLVEMVRQRLAIGRDISDVTIAASLAQIAARGTVRDRWLAAFGSPLGKHLAMRGSDLNTALHQLLSLAPRQNA